MSFIYGADYLALPRPKVIWIIDGLLPASGFLNVFGPPKSGKSRLVLHMASAITDPTQDTFLKWPIMTHGPVWYLQLDTPRGIFQTEYFRPLIEADQVINQIAVADREMDGMPYPFNLVDPKCREWLNTAIREANPRPIVFVLDTFRRSFAGDENDSSVASNVLHFLETALRVNPTTPGGDVYMPAIILISHAKKPNVDQHFDLTTANRGSGAVAGAMDCLLHVGKHGELRTEGRVMLEEVIQAKMLNPSGMWVLDEALGEEAPNKTDSKLLAFLTQPLTHGEWCKAAGVPVSTFAKGLRRLRNAGRVQQEGKHYMVCTEAA